RFFPDAAAAAAALHAGEIDLLLDPATERLDDLLDTPDAAAHVWPGTDVAMLALNVAAPADPGDPPPAFATPALRRAVALALDRPALAAALPGGRWRPTASPIGDDPPAPPPAMPGPDPAAPRRPPPGPG